MWQVRLRTAIFVYFICLDQDVDLHVTQLMPLPLTVSCFSKIQIGFTFLVPAHSGSPGKRAVKRVCVCVCQNCPIKMDILPSPIPSMVLKKENSYNQCQPVKPVVLLLRWLGKRVVSMQDSGTAGPGFKSQL